MLNDLMNNSGFDGFENEAQFDAEGAPTRLGVPAVQPRARHRSAPAQEEAFSSSEAEPVNEIAAEAAPRRRRVRASEQGAALVGEAVSQPSPARQADYSAASYDRPAAPVQVRRSAAPGENFSGARTAMPGEGYSGVRTAASGENYYGARTAVPQRSQQDRPGYQSASSQRAPEGYSRAASQEYRRPEPPVQRDEEEDEDEGSVFVPIIVVLVLIVVLALGVTVPDWNDIASKGGTMGKIGQIVLPLHQKARGVWDDLKEKVFPSAEAIQSAKVVSAGGVVPTEVHFSVQTAKDVQSLRIVTSQGNTVYSGTYTGNEDGVEEVEANSDHLIWTPTVILEEPFEGTFTVFAARADGVEKNTFHIEEPVSVVKPEEVLPALLSFDCTPSVISVIPAEAELTVQTSDAVAAVRVVDENSVPVVTLYRGAEEEGFSVTEQEDRLVWTMPVEFASSYTGTLSVQYETEDDLSFLPGDLSVAVQFGTDPVTDPLGSPEEETPDIGENDADGLPDEEPIEEDFIDEEPVEDEFADEDFDEEEPGEDNDEFVDEDFNEDFMEDAEGEPDEEEYGDLTAEEEFPDGDEPDALAEADGDLPEESDDLLADAEDAAEPAEDLTAQAEPEEVLPVATPLPVMEAVAEASADPAKLSLKTTLYNNGKQVKTYTRNKTVRMLDVLATMDKSTDYSADYAAWGQAGVLTFRGGPLRQNAAYGTADIQQEKLSVVWSQPVGSMKIDGGTAAGVTAPGQPLIVKWPVETRTKYLGLNDAAKEVKALKEVIVSAQDGNVYFYNLANGEATREPISLGAPSRGGLSLSTTGAPILGVGQFNKKLANKTVANGYHVLNLITNKKMELIAGDGKDKNSNYSGFTGSALFDKYTGTMIVGGQNGVLYTAELGNLNDTLDVDKAQLEISSNLQGYKTVVKDQKTTNTQIDGSVAMYSNYVYYGDQAGVLQCVDVNTLTPVWAVQLNDNVDATPALDVTEDGAALYVGTSFSRKYGKCGLYRLDALTGSVVWSKEISGLTYGGVAGEVGAAASPVVGAGEIDDLVIFTVTDDESAVVMALNKETGATVWEKKLSSAALSSPIALYNDQGEAWLVQAEEKNQIHLLRAASGEVADTLSLEPMEEDTAVVIKASPAAFKDQIIIGTTGKTGGGVYCLKVE